MTNGRSGGTNGATSPAAETVLIVGGGIAGMSAAIALTERGFKVTLLDVDPNWRVYGAGISITGMSLRAFDDLGVLPAIHERGFVHGGMRPRKMVGADGIYSTMRTMLFPDAPKPRFTNQGCWRFVGERPQDLESAEIYFGGPFKMGVTPISKTQVYVFVLEHVPGNPWFAPETHAKHLSDLIEPFGGTVPALRANLGADSQIVYRPLEWLLLEGPWFKGRVILIGDAAHATTPHLACGAGSAAEDGLVLADELSKGPDVQSALERFMTRRFERAKLVVDTSVGMGESEMNAGAKALSREDLAMLGAKLAEPY